MAVCFSILRVTGITNAVSNCCSQLLFNSPGLPAERAIYSADAFLFF